MWNSFPWLGEFTTGAVKGLIILKHLTINLLTWF